jgi:hypothetical protein
MMIGRSGLAGILAATLAGAALLGLEAQACSILPPPVPQAVTMFPGESPDDYAQRAQLHFDGFAAMQAQGERERATTRQSELWNASAGVAVVEVVSIKRDVPIGPPGQAYGSGNEVKVKVASWLKGKGSRGKTITLAHENYTSCGPTPMWRVMYGEPGQRFVMFFETGKAEQADAREGIEAGVIVAPEIIAALAAKAK